MGGGGGARDRPQAQGRDAEDPWGWSVTRGNGRQTTQCTGLRQGQVGGKGGRLWAGAQGPAPGTAPSRAPRARHGDRPEGYRLPRPLGTAPSHIHEPRVESIIMASGWRSARTVDIIWGSAMSVRWAARPGAPLTFSESAPAQAVGYSRLQWSRASMRHQKRVQSRSRGERCWGRGRASFEGGGGGLRGREGGGGGFGQPPLGEACAIAHAHKRRSAQKAPEESGSSVA